MALTRTQILVAMMMAGLFMTWPTTNQAQADSSDRQPTGSTIAQAGWSDTATNHSDVRNETASVESQRWRRGELYGAVYGGYTIGHGIDISGTGLGSFVNLGTIGLKDSGMFGGKVGYFFPSRGNWAGIEVEAFRTTPDVKGTTTGATIAGFPISLVGRQVPGAELTVTTVALNAVARAKFLCRPEADATNSVSLQQERPPLCPLQPYAGVGVGVFFADLAKPIRQYRKPCPWPQRPGGCSLLFHPASRSVR